MHAINALTELKKYATQERARVNEWFFKTGKGQYGEGDIFIGVTVPDTRRVAKAYTALSLSEILKLLKNPIHEARLLALHILVYKFQKGNETDGKKIYTFFLAHTKYINNWDLVDSSASYIVGTYLIDKNRNVLIELARSKNLWEKRIAIVATHAFIKKGEFTDTLHLAELLLSDTHDLIHKAVGWMLREVGKKNEEVLLQFIGTHYKDIPRTTLRYAIEKFPDDIRKTIIMKKHLSI